ncbi:MAG TPA: hypothetical protein VIY28_01725 [Pseudonocardiaceae bacterium]
MTDLRDFLQNYVSDGTVPGALDLVARGDRVEVAAVGSVDVEGTSTHGCTAPAPTFKES